LPELFSLKAESGSNIHLESFTSDSLHITLGDGCVLTGNNNTLRKVYYKTSGDVTMQFKNPL
jgi:hypothetical protein